MAEQVDKEHSHHTIDIISTHTKKRKKQKEMQKNSYFKPYMVTNSRRIRYLYKIFKQ